MCCSGSRASRRAISSQNRGSNAASGTSVQPGPRLTPCTCAAICSASVRGDSTPASASRAEATAISSSRRLIAASAASLTAAPRSRTGRQPLRRSASQRVDHGVQVAVDDLVEVVGLVADPVVGDPVLREVVGADPLASGRPCATWLRRSAAASASASSWAAASSRARRMRSACSLFCSWLFSFWQDTTMPVGRWVIRTAESVVFTLCPPGPGRAEHVDPQVVRVDGHLDRPRPPAGPARPRRRCGSGPGTR